MLGLTQHQSFLLVLLLLILTSFLPCVDAAVVSSTHWRLSTSGSPTYGTGLVRTDGFFVIGGIELFDSAGVRNNLVPTSRSESVGPGHYCCGAQHASVWNLNPTPQTGAHGTGNFCNNCYWGAQTGSWNAAIFASSVEVKTWSVWWVSGDFLLQYSKDNGVTWETHSAVMPSGYGWTGTSDMGYGTHGYGWSQIQGYGYSHGYGYDHWTDHNAIVPALGAISCQLNGYKWQIFCDGVYKRDFNEDPNMLDGAANSATPFSTVQDPGTQCKQQIADPTNVLSAICNDAPVPGLRNVDDWSHGIGLIITSQKSHRFSHIFRTCHAHARPPCCIHGRDTLYHTQTCRTTDET